MAVVFGWVIAFVFGILCLLAAFRRNARVSKLSSSASQIPLHLVPDEQRLGPISTPTQSEKQHLRLQEFIGQNRVKENIAIALEAARRRGEAVDHILLAGPEGFGKATLARAIADELGVAYDRTSSSVLKKILDLSGILSTMQPGQILLIEEVDRLRPEIQETLTNAANDFQLDLLVGSGPSARTVRIPINRFTLVGATSGALPKGRLRDSFSLVLNLELYTVEELTAFIVRWAGDLDIDVETEAAVQIAVASCGVPQTARILLKRCSDFALVEGNGKLSSPLAKRALQIIQPSRTMSGPQNEVLDCASRFDTDFMKMSGYEFEEWQRRYSENLDMKLSEPRARAIMGSTCGCSRTA